MACSQEARQNSPLLQRSIPPEQHNFSFLAVVRLWTEPLKQITPLGVACFENGVV
jgi:hypothetical protein